MVVIIGMQVESVAADSGVHCNSLRNTTCSPREVVPVSQDPGSGGMHRLPGVCG